MSINWLEIVVDEIDMHQNDLLMKFHQSSQANKQTNESNEICDELNLSFWLIDWKEERGKQNSTHSIIISVIRTEFMNVEKCASANCPALPMYLQALANNKFLCDVSHFSNEERQQS